MLEGGTVGVFFEEAEAGFFSWEALADLGNGAQELHVLFIEPAEHFVDAVPGFMGVAVLIGKPDFLLAPVDVAAAHVGVHPSTGSFRDREEGFAEPEGEPRGGVVEAN